MQTIDLKTRQDKLGSRLKTMIETGTEKAGAVFARLRAYPPQDSLTFLGKGGDLSIAQVDGAPDQIRIHDAKSDRSFARIHPHAMGQLAAILDLPGAHLRGELTSGTPWRVEGAAQYLNQHLTYAPQKRVLVRSASGEGEIRAVLSDKYRRTDSAELVRAFAAAIRIHGLLPIDARDDGLVWSVRALAPQGFAVELPDGSTDYLAPIVSLRNSDYGASATQLDLGAMRLVCANGAVGEVAHRSVHLGAAIPDDVELSEETIRSESLTLGLILRDSIASACKPERWGKVLAKIQKSAQTQVEKPAEFIAGLAKVRKLTQAQADAVSDLLLQRNPEQIPAGPVTRYTVAQAVSYLAHAEESTQARAELEALAATI
jgi:hypothetical protein